MNGENITRTRRTHIALVLVFRELGRREIDRQKVGPTEVSPSKIDSLQLGMLKVGVRQDRAFESTAIQHAVGEISTRKVRAVQIRPQFGTA
jgi:hypothetical protein